MKIAVFKLYLDDNKTQTKAEKAVSRFSGVESISMDMEDQKLTVIGDIDPLLVVRKLRKLCVTEIIYIRQAEEKEKEKKKVKEKEKKKKKKMKMKKWGGGGDGGNGVDEMNLYLGGDAPWGGESVEPLCYTQAGNISVTPSSVTVSAAFEVLGPESESVNYEYVKAYRAYSPHMRCPKETSGTP